MPVKKQRPEVDSVAFQPDNTVAFTLDGERYVLRSPRRSEGRELRAMYRAMVEDIFAVATENVERLQKRVDEMTDKGQTGQLTVLTRRIDEARQMLDSSSTDDDERVEKHVLTWWTRAFELCERNAKTLPEDTDRLPEWLCVDVQLVVATLEHWAAARPRRVPAGG